MSFIQETEGLAATDAVKAVTVVVAVFCREVADDKGQKHQEVLLAKRPQGRVYAGYWEFPGGKKEKDESLLQALRRELLEELAVDIGGHPMPKLLLVKEHHYPHALVQLHCYRINHWSGVFQLKEHDGIVWQRLSKTADLNEHKLAHHESSFPSPLLPANGEIFDLLMRDSA